MAGVDVHAGRGGTTAYAVAVLLDATSLDLLESVQLTLPLTFPYRTGLLSFREAPAVIAVLAQLSTRPDIVMVDGQGRAHPRRLGIASHIGVLTGLSTIGVAKSRLVGRHEEPGPITGDATPLEVAGDIVGAVLRTRARSRPLYISVGHRISLATAVRVVVAACRGFRLPEPTRMADRLSRAHPAN